MARISTHVLDTSRGKPAAGIAIDLYLGPVLLSQTGTNADGRTDRPPLEREQLETGAYTLIFHVADYLRSTAPSCEPFFETIRIQFHVRDGSENYHIPLLLSPYGYSTYRGS